MYRTYQNALWQTQKLPSLTAKKASEHKRAGPPTKLTEQQALECRARHEFYSWSLLKCSRHYKTSQQYMRTLLDYIVRRNLIAKPEHANITTNS